MNFRSILMIAAFAAFGAINVNAQINEDLSKVKILRTQDAGVIKMLYAMKTEEPIQVRFITRDGEFQRDKIRGQFSKGLSKRYDISGIKDQDFWMEISSSTMTVTYRINRSTDRTQFEPVLEKSVHNHLALSATNK